MNDWIYANKHFGEYLKNYNCGKGIPGFVKFSAIVTMCSVITFTAIIFIQETWIRLLLFATALAVSVHIATLKTCRNEQED